MESPKKKIIALYPSLLEILGPQGWWPLSWRSGRAGFDSRGYFTGGPRSRLTERDRFEISAGAILTQNTAWTNVEKALNSLRELGVSNADALLTCQDDSLKKAIKPCGYFNQKAKKLKLAFELFASSGCLRSGKPPDRDALLAVWGIGPETTDSILLYAFDAPYFVIDSYTKRFFSRLGLLEAGLDYASCQNAFSSCLPLDARLFNEYHALIVKFCKAFCLSKPLCGECPLKRSCRYRKIAAGG